MSDVLIKGMEMPEGCYYCPILIGRANCSCAITGAQIRIEKVREELEDERLPDCPLVELPPHGRLIDENDLHIKDTDGLLEAGTVWNAPTILEATE